MQKGFSLIFLVIVIAILGLTTGAYYLVKIKSSQNQPPTNLQIIPPVTKSSPPADIPSDWKVYTNTKAGYSLKLPPEAHLTEQDNPGSSLPDLISVVNISFPVAFDAQALPSNTIKVWKNLGVQIVDVKSRDTWCDLLTKELGPQDSCAISSSDFPYAETTFNGYKAFKPTSPNIKHGLEVFYIPYNNYVYQINLNNTKLQQTSSQITTIDDPIPHKMFETFKFISLTDSPTTWETYQGKRYNFAYPSNWQVKTSDYLNTVQITDSNNLVGIILSDDQYPYGFSGPTNNTVTDLTIKVAGKSFITKENSLDNTSAYTDFHLTTPKSLYILFGTGYPIVGTKASLKAYNDSKDIILKILSSLQFTQ